MALDPQSDNDSQGVAPGGSSGLWNVNLKAALGEGANDMDEFWIIIRIQMWMQLEKMGFSQNVK